MNDVIDATRELSPSVPLYLGDQAPVFTQRDGGQIAVTDLILTTHTGTHIDAPSHYIRNALPIDCIPFSKLMGPCRVINVENTTETINPTIVMKHLSGVKKVFFKTQASNMDCFDVTYPHINLDLAKLIVTNGIDCIGIDSPSIEAFDGGGAVHRELLSGGVIIIELLDLSSVREGDYWMIALPLKLKGLDGSPCRVILLNSMETFHEPHWKGSK